MGEKFEVISNDGIDDMVVKLNRAEKATELSQIWARQCSCAVLQAEEENKGLRLSDYPQGDLMKIAFCGVKYISTLDSVRNESEKVGIGYKQMLQLTSEIFQFIGGIFTVCGCLTLRNFVTAFPITKDYDGEKWGCKDYFFTMKILSGMDWDKPIGAENISKLLWNYENVDLRLAYGEYMCAMSDMYKFQSGKGIAEEWCDEIGIPTYSVNEDKGYIRDNQTGNISMIVKNPSHLQIVKC